MSFSAVILVNTEIRGRVPKGTLFICNPRVLCTKAAQSTESRYARVTSLIDGVYDLRMPLAELQRLGKSTTCLIQSYDSVLRQSYLKLNCYFWPPVYTISLPFLDLRM